jgi:hypothetical protein
MAFVQDGAQRFRSLLGAVSTAAAELLRRRS